MEEKIAARSVVLNVPDLQQFVLGFVSVTTLYLVRSVSKGWRAQVEHRRFRLEIASRIAEWQKGPWQGSWEWVRDYHCRTCLCVTGSADEIAAAEARLQSQGAEAVRKREAHIRYWKGWICFPCQERSEYGLETAEEWRKEDEADTTWRLDEQELLEIAEPCRLDKVPFFRIQAVKEDLAQRFSDPDKMHWAVRSLSEAQRKLENSRDALQHPRAAQETLRRLRRCLSDRGRGTVPTSLLLPQPPDHSLPWLDTDLEESGDFSDMCQETSHSGFGPIAHVVHVSSSRKRTEDTRSKFLAALDARTGASH